MKIKSTILASVVGAAVLGGSVQANTVEFYDFDSATEIFLRNVAAPGNIRDWTISIDFDPALWTSVTSASLWLNLSDDGDHQPETARLTAFSPDRVIELPGGSTPTWYDAGDVTSLLNVGSLDRFVTILAAEPGKDFFYHNAKLVVSFVAVPVPEAAQWLLMGAGLLAVGGWAGRRRGVLNPA
jgi:hypothetical protein